MQSRISRKVVAVILANGIRNQLHPLTMNFPITNLPIGNKKLITYQLQQLQQVPEIGTIIIAYSQQSTKLKSYLQSQFLVSHPNYPHHIQFYRVENNLSEYNTLQKLLNDSTLYAQGWQQCKALLLVPRDLISSIKFKMFVEDMISLKSDVGIFAKVKKQYGKDQKKPEVDYEGNFDIGLIGQKGQVYSLRSVENYEYSGFSLPASIYQKATHATFQRIIDTRLYTFSPRIIKIIKNLQSSQLCNIKSDLLDTLIRNQNNTNLLSHTDQKHPLKPLRIYSKIANQNQYIRSISNISIYESTNLDSLIRGPKQKQILIPNKYTQQTDEKYMQQFRGCLIGKDCTIETGNKLTRCVIENGCKIGKGVDISNSILMAGSVVQDGCKIGNTIVGPNCQVRMQSVLLYCQLAMGCVVEKGSNIEKQMIIPLQ